MACLVQSIASANSFYYVQRAPAVYLCNYSMLYVTIYGAEGACRAGNHVAGTLWAVGPCRAAASCRALLRLGGSRTVDTEVTRGREMMRRDNWEECVGNDG